MFSSRRPARSRERTILRLTVEAAERIHPQEHVVYCVVAVCTDGVRRRWRRYSQFHAFHAQLPEARRIPFPGKKWRQQLGFNAVERRRVKLDAFLTELLDTPLTFKSRVELRSFLGLPPPTPPSAPQQSFLNHRDDNGCSDPLQRQHRNWTEVGATTWSTTSRLVSEKERSRSREVRSVGVDDKRVRDCESIARVRSSNFATEYRACATFVNARLDSNCCVGENAHRHNRSQGMRRSCSAMTLQREDFSSASSQTSRRERAHISRAHSVDRELADGDVREMETQGRPKTSALARGRRRGGAGGGFGDVYHLRGDSSVGVAMPSDYNDANDGNSHDANGDRDSECEGGRVDGGVGGNVLAETCMVDELASAQADAQSMQARAALLSEYAAGNISADEWRIFDAVEERNHDARRRRRRARSVAGGGVGGIAGIGGSISDGSSGFGGIGGRSGRELSGGSAVQLLARGAFGGLRGGGASVCGNIGRSHSVASASSCSIGLDASGINVAMDGDDDATMEVDLHCTGGLMWPLLPDGAPTPTLPPSLASSLAMEMETPTPITVPIAVRAQDGRPVPTRDQDRSISMDLANLQRGMPHTVDSGNDIDRMAEVIVGSLGRGCGGGALRIPTDEVVCTSTMNIPTKPGNEVRDASTSDAGDGISDLEPTPQSPATFKESGHHDLVASTLTPAPVPAPSPARTCAPTTNYDALMAARLRKRRADARAEGTLRARGSVLMRSSTHQSCSSDLTADTRDWLLDQLAKRGEITEAERQHIQDKCDAHALQLQAELDEFYLGTETAATSNAAVIALSQRCSDAGRRQRGDQATIERGPTYLVVGGENDVAKGANAPSPNPRFFLPGTRPASPQITTPPAQKSAAPPRISPGVSPELWRPSCWPQGGKSASSDARLQFPSALREHNLQRRKATKMQMDADESVASAQP